MAGATEGLLAKVRPRIAAGMNAVAGVADSHAAPRPTAAGLVVAEASSRFDFPRVAATDRINGGLNSEDIISEPEWWYRWFGIDVWQAHIDVVALHFRYGNERSSYPATEKRASRIFRKCSSLVRTSCPGSD